jgi:hypothetical protein
MPFVPRTADDSKVSIEVSRCQVTLNQPRLQSTTSGESQVLRKGWQAVLDRHRIAGSRIGRIPLNIWVSFLPG